MEASSGKSVKRASKWLFIVLLICGVLLTLRLGDRIISQWFKETSLPPGWYIIRPPENVMALEIHGDVIWVGGRDGVFEIDRKNRCLIRKLEVDQSLNYVKDLLIDQSGKIWIAHSRGLSVYDGIELITFTEKEGLPDNRVNSLLIDDEGRLWIGTCRGAAVRKDNEWYKIDKSSGLIDNMVNVIYQDSYGGIWFGSHVAPRGGITLIMGEYWRYFSTDNNIPHNNITSFFEESPGKMWTGTGFLDKGGAVLFSFSENDWRIERILTTKDGLVGNRVRYIFKDSYGGLWFTSEYNGVTRFHNGKSSVFNKYSGFSHDEITSIVEDEDKTLWFGTFDGITVITESAVSSLP